MSMVEQRPPDVTVVDRGEHGGPPRSRATRTLGVMVSLVVLAIIVIVVLQVFQGCWIDVGNELDHQPSVGYVTPPRGSAADAAVPVQGRDLLETSSDPMRSVPRPRDAGDPTNPVPTSPPSMARGLRSTRSSASCATGSPAPTRRAAWGPPSSPTPIRPTSRPWRRR